MALGYNHFKRCDLVVGNYLYHRFARLENAMH